MTSYEVVMAMYTCTHSERAALPAGDVKIDDIVSRNDVGDTITILSYLWRNNNPINAHLSDLLVN